MTLPEFINAALGVPFRERGRDYAGWDCWGLVRCAYRDVWGIDLPSYAEGYPAPARSVEGREAMRDVVQAATAQGGAWRAVAAPRAGDVVVLRVTGRPIHVGLLLDGERFIHAEDKVGAVIEKLASPAWSRRLDGFYRHAG